MTPCLEMLGKSETYLIYIETWYQSILFDGFRWPKRKNVCNKLTELQPCVCLRKPSERHWVSICIVIWAGFAHKIYSFLWIEAKPIISIFMSIHENKFWHKFYLWIKECWCNEILWGNFHNPRFISLLQSFHHQGIYSTNWI